MDCATCKENRRRVEPVPYISHDADMERNERLLKRIVTALIVVIILWFATISLFVWYLNQYDYQSYTEEYAYTQDGQGLNIIGDRNGVDFYVAEDELSQTN